MTSELAPGDIVLVPVSYSDYSGKKRRPAIVLSSKEFNSSSLDVILVAVSSNLTRRLHFEIPILVTDPGFSETDLAKSSVIKCAAIFAYSKSRIDRRLGKLPSPVLKQVQKKIGEILDILPFS